MSDKPKAEDSFVYVSEKYLKELEQKAQDSEYFRGRVHGMEKERAMIDLKAIALELLEKYGDSENAVICEYSGNIDEDMRELEKEISDYYERIERTDRSRR